MSSLLNLLLLSSPSVKIVVLKVIQHIVKISIPFEVFEEAVRVLTRDEKSLAHRILHKVQPKAKFANSMFIRFLFNYLLSLRSKMWSGADAESDGQYAVSQAVSATLRVIGSVRAADWSKQVKEEITNALLTVESLPVPEADAVKTADRTEARWMEKHQILSLLLLLVVEQSEGHLLGISELRRQSQRLQNLVVLAAALAGLDQLRDRLPGG